MIMPKLQPAKKVLEFKENTLAIVNENLGYKLPEGLRRSQEIHKYRLEFQIEQLKRQVENVN